MNKDISLGGTNDYDDSLPVLGDPASIDMIQNSDWNHVIGGKMNLLKSTLQASGTASDDHLENQQHSILNQSIQRQESPPIQTLNPHGLPHELTTLSEADDIQQTSSSSNLSLSILSPSQQSSESGDDIDVNFPSKSAPIESTDETSSPNKNAINQRDIHHPAHDHSLSLIQRADVWSICDLCSKEFDGTSWHCTEGCDFDICRECIDADELSTQNVPDIKHDNSESTDMQSVEHDIDLNFSSTTVPIESADETPSLDKKLTDIQHPAHDHSLSLIQRTDCDSMICDLCSNEFDGQSWHCTEGCDFDICRDCIDADEFKGSTESPQDNSESTDTQSVEASISIEIMESTEERERRGRKRKRMEQESDSEERRIRRKIQKLDRDARREPENESECVSEKDDFTDDGDHCVDLRGDSRTLYNVRCNTLRCDECGKGFMKHKEFITHMKEEHNECSPYECHLCTKTFQRRERLMDHYKKHEDGDLNNSVSTEPRRRGHLKRRGTKQKSAISTCNTTENLRCDDCNKQFESHEELIDHLKVEHMRTKNEAKQVMEKYIEETMNRKEIYQRFMELIETGEVEINDTSFLCHINECGKTFKSRCHLKRHVNEIHFGRRYKCTFPDCTYSEHGGNFKQKTQAKEHVSNVHFRLKREWQCVLCGDDFTRWSGVKLHLELQRCRLLKAEGRAMTSTDVLECKPQCRRNTRKAMNQT